MAVSRAGRKAAPTACGKADPWAVLWVVGSAVWKVAATAAPWAFAKVVRKAASRAGSMVERTVDMRAAQWVVSRAGPMVDSWAEALADARAEQLAAVWGIWSAAA